MTTAVGPGSARGWGLDDVSVRVAGVVAIEGVSLVATRGAVTAVVGGDGAGKTTTLRTLVGLLIPVMGRVDRPPTAEIGYVSAGTGVYSDLTVDENLSFFGRAYGLGSIEIARRAAPLLSRIGLADVRDRLAGQLSGGMRQKLAVATALLHAPSLLVLDEPTTGVDPVSRAEIWQLLAGIAARGAAIVITTTYLDEAERAATVLVLLDGRPLVSGEPAAVVRAMPGAIAVGQSRPDPARSWRRGPGWRIWSPDGVLPTGSRQIVPDLEDAVVVAQLGAAQRRADGSAA